MMRFSRRSLQLPSTSLAKSGLSRERGALVSRSSMAAFWRSPANFKRLTSRLLNTRAKKTTMLTHPTQERLIALGLTGMAKALEEQRRQPDVAAFAFEERLALLVDREAIERENKRLVSRLKCAGLRQNAAIEDLDTKAPRSLDRPLFARLVEGSWIERRENLIIVGKTGLGKSWLACALGHKACRDDRSVLYHRLPRLLDALALARGDGRHARLLKTIARVERLILADWGLAYLTGE